MVKHFTGEKRRSHTRPCPFPLISTGPAKFENSRPPRSTWYTHNTPLTGETFHYTYSIHNTRDPENGEYREEDYTHTYTCPVECSFQIGESFKVLISSVLRSPPLLWAGVMHTRGMLCSCTAEEGRKKRRPAFKRYRAYIALFAVRRPIARSSIDV